MRKPVRRTGESTCLAVVGEGDAAVGRVLAGGVATSTLVAEGVEPGGAALAAPIRHGGRVVAALSLLVPSFRADGTTVVSSTTALRDAAAAIDARLGGTPVTEVAG